jgi:hypothetical protein
MSMSNPKVPKPDPTKTYVCMMSFVSEKGGVHAGTRLRGDHPEALARPSLFVEESTPDPQRLEIMRQRYPDFLVGDFFQG